MINNEKIRDVHSVGEGMRAMLYLLRGKGRDVLLLSLFSLLTALGLASLPYVTGLFFDSIINIENTGAYTDSWEFTITLFAVIAFVTALLRYTADKKRFLVTVAMHLGIQSRSFVHVIGLPLTFHKNAHIGGVIEEFSSASWRIKEVVSQVGQFAPHLLALFVGIGYVFSVHAFFGVVLVISSVLFVILLARNVRKLPEHDKKMYEIWNAVYNHGSEVLHQIENVKYAAMEEREKKTITHDYLKKLLPAWILTFGFDTRLTLSQDIITLAAQVTIFSLSVGLVATGSMSVGQLIAINSYALMFFSPLVSFASDWGSVRTGLSDAVRLRNLFEKEEEVLHPKDAVSLPRGVHDIVFDDVTFAYDKGNSVLHNVSLSIKGGSSTALVGQSGSGKSTLVSLISAFMFANTGSVNVGRHDVRTLDLISLRSQIAIVPQEIALFHTTIEDNIRYGTPDATHEEVVAVAKKARLAEYIEGLPLQYETIVGERGVKLSVGQKQRVAIARAFLRNPTILILDEPTSALDAETERFIQDSLKELMKGRTTIIIAHRLSTIREVDRILVLDDGHVVEDGTHDELVIKENGKYRNLYEHHAGLHE